MRAVEAEGNAGMPPRVFLSKSAEVIENKGQESQKRAAREVKSAQAIENKGQLARPGIARIKRLRIHLGLRGKGRTKRGHGQQNLGLEVTAFVTICQVRNKCCELNGLG
jgi:hypothetical protein